MNLASEKQPLASEIIADQAAEVDIPRKRYRLYMELRKVLIRTSSKKNRRERTNGKMRFNSSSLPKSYHGSGSEQQKQKIITAHL